MMDALTTPNKSLFLSYSRVQTTWCDSLYTAIDTHTHYQRWRDNKIPESADWWDMICFNIEGCFAFVAILTQDYLDSVYCMGELDYALKLKKPVIALMLKDVQYPPKLDEMRLQFARVGDLDMPMVINRVLNACNQITLGYTAGDYSTDIHIRKHLRPPVPMPPVTQALPDEDIVLHQQIDSLVVHGHLPIRDLMKRYHEEKTGNILFARDLLNKIRQRSDVPFFFDLDEEEQELTILEEQWMKTEQERLLLKKINTDYADLVHYVALVSPPVARKAINRFMITYPDFGDPEGLKSQFPSSRSLMPAPFEWITIPAGRGTMKTNEDVTLEMPTEAYQIAKYPITNGQYAKFVDAGGYKNEQWWTDAGWEARLKGWVWNSSKQEFEITNNPWTEPRYWSDSKWNGANQPVVGVSWYEAVAFCLWLSDVTGEKIMLPTEAQWQYAAQGTDGRQYPWGNDWDKDKCNSRESGHGKTTPVTQYEKVGKSPFGVVDMAGNVWEWCLTDYEQLTNDINSNANRRVLRGGSWSSYNSGLLRVANRFRNNPNNRNYNNGFRCVLSQLTIGQHSSEF